MQVLERIELKRDVKVIQIPIGDEHELMKGEIVGITQEMGGNFKIKARGNFYQLNGEDADAIGKDVQKIETPSHSEDDLENPVDEEKIWEQLQTVHDPEIPVNIVDLGLICSLKTELLPNGKGNKVTVDMTLTAPTCPVGPMIQNEAKQKILSVAGVTEADVNLVWEPQWDRAMMSDAAKLKLGML